MKAALKYIKGIFFARFFFYINLMNVQCLVYIQIFLHTHFQIFAHPCLEIHLAHKSLNFSVLYGKMQESVFSCPAAQEVTMSVGLL